MIYAVLLGTLTVLTFAFNSVRSMMRFMNKDRLDSFIQEQFDEYSRIHVLMFFFIELAMIILVLIFSCLNQAFLATMMMELALFFELIVTVSITTIFGNRFCFIFSCFLSLVNALMIACILIERIPGLSKIFLGYANVIFMINIFLFIITFVFASCFGLSIVNLANQVIKNKDDYKQGTYKVSKKSILRKVLLSEELIKESFKEETNDII